MTETRTAFGPHLFVGVADDPDHCITCGLTTDDGRAEHEQDADADDHGAPFYPPNLPAPIGDAQGVVDVEALRELAPRLRRELVEALRYSTAVARQARGTVVTPEDTFDLVRRLTHAGEVLRQMAGAFDLAAKETDALLDEEAQTAMGEQEGVPNGSLFVPDGVGTRICVRPDYKAGESSWDLQSLVGWLAETEATRWADEQDTQRTQALIDLDDAAGVAEIVARRALDKLLSMGNYSPKSTEVDAQRIAAAERGDDASAALLAQLRKVGARVYKGVKITREAQPKSKRTTR